MNRPADLLLHIGTEKTGTTSIQHFMAANRSLLRKQGVLYPRSPGETNHFGIPSLAQDRNKGELWKNLGIADLEDRDRYARDLAQRLTAELAEEPYETAIISSEHCSSRLMSDREVETLRAFLAPFFRSVRILVYLRRQDDFAVSTYSTGVKSGRTNPLELPRKRRVRDRYDYWELLSRWRRAFGRENMLCRKFEPASFVSGDLIADFLTAAGCDPHLEWRRPGSVNGSLDARSLEFLRLLNVHAGTDRPPRLLQMLESVSDGPLIDIPERQRAALMRKVRDSNAMVAREYFGGELTGSDDPLFRPRWDKRDRVCEQELSIGEIVALAARLLSIEGPVRRRRNKATAAGNGVS